MAKFNGDTISFYFVKREHNGVKTDFSKVEVIAESSTLCMVRLPEKIRKTKQDGLDR
jgi:hypothetical protein